MASNYILKFVGSAEGSLVEVDHRGGGRSQIKILYFLADTPHNKKLEIKILLLLAYAVERFHSRLDFLIFLNLALGAKKSPDEIPIIYFLLIL